MMQVTLLLLVSLFFVVLPRHETNTNVMTVQYEDLPSPELYAACDKIFRACKHGACEIDRDQCATWRGR